MLCYALHSLRITEYSYVLTENRNKGTKLQDVVDTLKILDDDKRLDSFIDSYLVSIKFNSRQNEQNAEISIGVIIVLAAIPFIIMIIQPFL